jgi:hypothetical protein
MQAKIEKLEKDVRRLKAFAMTLAVILTAFIIAAFRPQSGDDEILRARGLVIVDDAGRERILLGAPIPDAAGRVRTDLGRVRELWAGRFPDPDKYMEWYSGYDHSMNGLLILDESGFDRLALGETVPDPNIGKRIGPETGIVINNEAGFERSGYGLLNVDGVYRVVLGMDSKKGNEGLVLMLDDAGPNGLMVRGGDRLGYLGVAQADGLPGVKEELFGLVLVKDGEVKEKITAEGK